MSAPKPRVSDPAKEHAAHIRRNLDCGCASICAAAQDSLRDARARLAAVEKVVTEIRAIAELCLLDGDRIVQTSAFGNGAPRHAAGLALERLIAALDALRAGEKEDR